MEDLIIPRKPDSFMVNCKYANGEIEIEGCSYPENAVLFFDPIFDWIEKFLRNENRPLSFNFKVDYNNTSTEKSLLDLFYLLDDYYTNFGNKINIVWYNRQEDGEIKEAWLDFADTHDLNIQFIQN